ncbi:hypothetical protein C8J57DRAFT_1240665 [Mycena rebaudengoi]|nr:hypothetical protein C8J57DRAFT_1240665 [Mycena rebaudengoi]
MPNFWSTFPVFFLLFAMFAVYRTSSASHSKWIYAYIGPTSQLLLPPPAAPDNLDLLHHQGQWALQCLGELQVWVIAFLVPFSIQFGPAAAAAATSHVSVGVQVDSSYFFLPPSNLNVLMLPDAAHIVSLAQGGGISAMALQALLVQCPTCSKYFIGTIVEEHIETCGQ